MNTIATGSSGAEAKALLDRLTNAVNQPDVRLIIDTLDEAEQTCLQQIIDFRCESIHDVLNHFSLIGEVRGLRRFMHEVREKVNEAKEVIAESERLAEQETITTTSTNA